MTSIIPANLPPKLGSKEIVQEFIDSDLTRCVVVTDGMDRQPNSVYVSLRGYLSNHPEFQISVSLQDGQITLSKE